MFLGLPVLAQRSQSQQLLTNPQAGLLSTKAPNGPSNSTLKSAIASLGHAGSSAGTQLL